MYRGVSRERSYGTSVIGDTAAYVLSKADKEEMVPVVSASEAFVPRRGYDPVGASVKADDLPDSRIEGPEYSEAVLEIPDVGLSVSDCGREVRISDSGVIDFAFIHGLLGPADEKDFDGAIREILQEAVYQRLVGGLVPAVEHRLVYQKQFHKDVNLIKGTKFFANSDKFITFVSAYAGLAHR